MVQYYYDGEEYTTRRRLLAKYNIPHTNLQTLLEREQLTKITDLNKYYFLKAEVERVVEEYLKK